MFAYTCLPLSPLQIHCQLSTVTSSGVFRIGLCSWKKLSVLLLVNGKLAFWLVKFMGIFREYVLKFFSSKCTKYTLWRPVGTLHSSQDPGLRGAYF